MTATLFTTTLRPRPSTPAGGLATILALLAALLATSAAAWGNPIAPEFALSDAEAARPVFLDANGNRIVVVKGPKGTTTVRPSDATPAYVAYRLDKASGLPSGYPTVKVGPGSPHTGPARGPLHLDTLAKSTLDAAIARTGGTAAVQLPHQTYVVESIAALVGSSSDASTRIWLASNGGSTVARPALSGNSSVGDTLKGWFDTSTSAVVNLNKQIADAIKSRFTLKSPQPVIYPAPNKTKARTAAQMLTPPAAAEGAVQPAPVPEPASVLVFAAAGVAAAWRLRAGRKPR